MIRITSAEEITTAIEAAAMFQLARPPVQHGHNWRRVLLNNGVHQKPLPVAADHVLLSIVPLPRKTGDWPGRKQGNRVMPRVTIGTIAEICGASVI